MPKPSSSDLPPRKVEYTIAVAAGAEKVVRRGLAGNVGVPEGCGRRGVVVVAAAAPEIGGIHDRGARWIDLGHETVGTAVQCRLDRGWAHAREVRRGRATSHIGVAQGIDGDREYGVAPRPAKVRRIDERRAGGVDLGNEGIGPGADLGGRDGDRA